MSTVLGIDVGGTFTDVVVLRDDGPDIIDKVPSTPHDPSEGVIASIRALRDVQGLDLASLSFFAHGSTTATNALLEFKLPRTALLTTRGFRDVLEIGTQTRHQMFDLRLRKAEPWVPRELVFEVTERVDREGNVVVPLTQKEIRRVTDVVLAADVEAVGICFLFSFFNAAHEEQLAEAIRRARPGISVAISAHVAPEIKEYPRASTTAMSAALQPIVARYMGGIEDGLAREAVAAPFFVMQSSGGVMSAAEASRHAHRMVLSGPAAGVLAGTRLAETTRWRNQITFDMGGTSTDICLIHDGRPRLNRETLFEGRALKVPQFDMHTIGAGGGSLAVADAAGLLKVGPESAGAVPGPACYGRGGTRPTTTDAQLVLGRIHPDRFLGGEMRLDRQAAIDAVRTHVAEPLGLSLEAAAQGIIDIADATMARGVRVVSVNRGYDPRDFHLVAFGGAGPMHAVAVGQAVEVAGVLVPPRPGTFSAVGLASSDLKFDTTQVIERPIDQFTPTEIERLFEPLLEAGAAYIRQEARDIITIDGLRLVRMRYAWQDNDVELLLDPGPLTEAVVASLVARFHERHEFEFGHRDDDGRVEIAAVGVEVYGRLQRAKTADQLAAASGPAVPATTRQVYFREFGWSEVPVYERADLRAGHRFSGPAIVEEREATTVVAPGTTAEVDVTGTLVIRIGTKGGDDHAN